MVCLFNAEADESTSAGVLRDLCHRVIFLCICDVAKTYQRDLNAEGLESLVTVMRMLQESGQEKGVGSLR